MTELRRKRIEAVTKAKIEKSIKQAEARINRRKYTSPTAKRVYESPTVEGNLHPVPHRQREFIELFLIFTIVFIMVGGVTTKIKEMSSSFDLQTNTIDQIVENIRDPEYLEEFGVEFNKGIVLLSETIYSFGGTVNGLYNGIASIFNFVKDIQTPNLIFGDFAFGSIGQFIRNFQNPFGFLR